MNFRILADLTSTNSFGIISSAGRTAIRNEPSLDPEVTIVSHLQNKLKSNRIITPSEIHNIYGSRGHFVQLKNFHLQSRVVAQNRNIKPLRKLRKITDPADRASAQKELEEMFDFHQMLTFLVST